jgi:hypothetical protein
MTMTPPDIAAVAGKLSDGERQAMLNDNPIILPTDWKIVRPNGNAFARLTEKGLLRIGPDDIGWVATPLGQVVRAHLLENGGG